MSYTCKYLQFGGEKPVPGFNELTLDSSEIPAPVFKFLADPATKELWDLVFSAQADKTGVHFYIGDQPVPGGMDARVKSWYMKETPGGPGHLLTVMPMIIDKSGVRFPEDGEMIVKFNVPGAIGNTINTDNIPGNTVLGEISGQYGITHFGMHGENNGILITTRVNEFDSLLPLTQDNTTRIEGNKIAVKKGHTCLVLAIFREKIRTHFKSITPKPNTDIIPDIGISILKELAAKERVTVMPDLSFNISGFKDIKSAETLVDAVIEAHVPVLN
ncbi:MAG: hypothetical protein U0U70_05505 [Chitinophagaceae bacterium]